MTFASKAALLAAVPGAARVAAQIPELEAVSKLERAAFGVTKQWLGHLSCWDYSLVVFDTSAPMFTGAIGCEARVLCTWLDLEGTEPPPEEARQGNPLRTFTRVPAGTVPEKADKRLIYPPVDNT